jgi:hypothetical protein
LQKRGFIAVQQKGAFNLKANKGQATEWRLTELPFGRLGTASKEFHHWSEGNDFPVSKAPKPTHRRSVTAAPQQVSPLVNYKCPPGGTRDPKKLQIESSERDQNATSAQHLSHQRDQLVPRERLEVPVERPRSEFSTARMRAAGGSA